MNNEFKIGDIIIVQPSHYTVALLVRQISLNKTLHGGLIPMFNKFPIGKYLYEDRIDIGWKKARRTKKRLKEAKRCLRVVHKARGIDNLTYVEVLNQLNERTKS